MSDNAYGSQKKVSRKCQQIGLTFDSQGKFQAILLMVLQCPTSMLETSSLVLLLYRTQFLKELFTSYDLHFLPGFLESLLGLRFHVQRILFVVTSYFQVQPISVAKAFLSMFTQPIKSPMPHKKDIHVTMSPVQAEFPTAAAGQTIKFVSVSQEETHFSLHA